MKMISAGSLGVVLILLLLATAALCLLTGNTRRSYPTLARSDKVIVAGKTVALEQLAASHQPLLAQRVGEESPPALTMWWEAIDAGDAIALVYHPVWQDERHPDPLLHWLYYAYRAIVYGLPVRDIEYIQINISRADGRIQRVRYEGSTATAYDQPIAEHVQITIDRSDTAYKETATLPNNETRVRPVRLTSPRLSFGITTWSHQFVLLEDGAGSYAVPVPMPLGYLTGENYAKHKLARRSQGDFATREGVVGRTAKSVIRTVMLGVPYLLSQLRYANTPTESANEPAEAHSIRCPYCDHEFDISLRTAEDTRLPVEKAELQVLPYARDVELFDPDPHAEGKTNSQWTKIGEDFFGGLNYESIGILHMEKGWQVRYCVARCPHCLMLIDVFANLTQAQPLAAMWPHLLGKSPDGGCIKPWRPTSILSRLFGETFFVLVFLILLYIGSLAPQIVSYTHQTIFDIDRFRAEAMPVFGIRGIVVISVFLLIWLRKKLIELFGDEKFSDLLDIKRGLITYWSNFAVCRFTGYQKEGWLFSRTQ